MRNMRSALWALGLAGASYAWKNRDRLRGQLNALNGGGQRRIPLQLPGVSQRRIEAPLQNRSERPSETKFGGSEV